MVRSDQLLLLVTVAGAAAAAEVPRPRGVGPDLAKHYKDPETFSCIFNPAIKVSTAQINDDYCDCPDGSDEPGTAACAHLSYHAPRVAAVSGVNSTLALPGFYCKNKGHIPAYLPLSNVNDGVCDYDTCCDGSDEWARVGGISCPDKCKEIGREWRHHDETRQKAMTAALKKRAELVKESARLRKEVEDKVVDLGVQIQASEIKVKSLADALSEAERTSRGRIVRGAGKAGRTAILAGMAKNRVEELRNSLGQVKAARDEARSRLEELETLLTTFKEEYNPNFNDEGVKRAVRAWEDYAARDKPSVASDPVEDADLLELLKTDEESKVIDWAEWERGDDESDTDLLYQFEAYLPGFARTWLDIKLKALRLFLIESGVIAPATDSGEDPVVTSARSALQEAEKTLKDQQTDLASSKEDTQADYGPEGVFRALKGTCITKDSGEYTYELCFLDQAKQKPKKGGADTGMGRFVRFDKTTVDEALPADGKGLGSGERLVLKYENGQHCWNGPSRSTSVVLACAEEPEIWKIAEEEKCVYRMEIGSPAVCDRRKSAGDAGGAAAAKDEL